MTVSSVFAGANSGAVTQTGSSTQGKGLNSLGANDFLKLMLAQMKQQDPLSPMDNKEMLAQMAQFSTLSNQTEMNSTLKLMIEKLNVIATNTTPPPAEDETAAEIAADETNKTNPAAA